MAEQEAKVAVAARDSVAVVQDPAVVTPTKPVVAAETKPAVAVVTTSAVAVAEAAKEPVVPFAAVSPGELPAPAAAESGALQTAAAASG